jgi:hypothetical protein
MINLNDPLAVLATRLPWAQLEAAIAAKFARSVDTGAVVCCRRPKTEPLEVRTVAQIWIGADSGKQIMQVLFCNPAISRHGANLLKPGYGAGLE